MSRTCLGGVLLLVATGAGCLGLVENRQIRERPGATSTRDGREPDTHTRVRARFEGTSLVASVLNEATCFVEQYQQVERVADITREFEPSAYTWWITEWICGAACTAGGLVSILLAPTLNAETAASDGLSEQTQLYLAGAAAAALGVGSLIAAIVESVRAKDEVQTLPPEMRLVSRTPQPCDQRPLPGAPIELRLANFRVPVGVTGPDGSLVVDLRPIVTARHLRAADTSGTVTIVAYDQPVGEIQIGPYVVALDDSAWSAAERTGLPDDLHQYLQEWPDGRYAREATRRLDETLWQRVQDHPSRETVEEYIRAHPAGLHAAEAVGRLERYDWEEADRVNSVEAMEAYLQSHPDGYFGPEARSRIVVLLIDAGNIATAEARITRYADEDVVFRAEAESLRGRLEEARNQRRRSAEDALREAVRLAAGCNGESKPEIAARAYRRLQTAARVLPEDRIAEARQQIMAACGSCSPQCAGVE